MTDKEKRYKLFKFASIFLSIFLVIVLGLFFKKNQKPVSNKSSASSSALAEKAKPILEAKVEKSFDFPISKTTKDKFTIKVDKVDVVKLVTTKGKAVLAKDGEAFLLIYLQIENNLTSGLTVNSQNYFRLVDENEKRFAPDFYNTSVQVAAISTKKDNVGFVVKDGQKDFKLQVGEIDGEKQVIDIKF